MTFERPILFIDTETTGVDPVKDRIVEIGMLQLHPDGKRFKWAQRFNPGMPIPAEATAVHGITDADVEGCPRFGVWAERIAAGMKGRDLGGYNLRFDLPIIDEELRRCGQRVDLTGVRVIDAFGIFQKKDPRKLEDAVRKYCGREHDGAHGALADAEASADVLMGQVAAYTDLGGMTVNELAEYSRMGENRMADLAGKLYYDQDGRLRFGFGKWRDTLVTEHLDYAEWMVGKGGFPGSTVELLRQVI